MFLNRQHTINLVFAFFYLFFSFSVKSAENLSLQQTPEIIQATNLLDSWSGQTNKLKNAKNLLDVELEKNPQSVLARKELARYYIMSGFIRGNSYEPGTFQKSEKILLDAIEIDPNFSGTYVLLGYVYENMNRLSDAEKMLNKADYLGTDDPWLHLNWVSLLKKLGRTDEIKPRYLAVITSKTENIKALAAAYSFLIDDSIKLKQYDDVTKYYEKIFELNPDNAWSRGNYADFLRTEVGDFDAAVFNARKALKTMKYGIGYRILGLSLFAQWGDSLDKGMEPDQAEVIFKEASEVYPNLNYAVAHLGAFETTFPVLKHLLKKGVSLNETNKNGYTALSWAADKGKTDLCIKLLKMGVDPDIPTINGLTALTLAILGGHTETALALLNNGVNPRPGTSKFDALSAAQRANNSIVIEEINNILK